MMGKCFGRWPQILAEGEDIYMVRAEIAHDLFGFFGIFAESQHEAGFGWDRGRNCLSMGQHVERAFVAGAETDLAIEARNGFDVVIENIRETRS